ncbi:MAG: hypothetical protein MK212_14770, partial [Saprospiraceae bacterium]|nr:hypothetical protein [Saprospiraceae bacterium]
MKLKLHLLGLLSCLLLCTKSVCALTPGDIAIIQYNSDGPEGFAFVALTDIPAGEVIFFTDNGWLSSGSFRSNEGTITWTAPVGGVACGTIVTITNNSADIGVATGSVALAASGDQVLAYQGSSSSPSFIYAINAEGSAVWQANATSSNTSALPTGLIDGVTAVAITEVDNAAYNGALTNNTRLALQGAIGTSTNWSNTSNSSPVSYAGGPFTVTECNTCTEPTTTTSAMVATPTAGATSTSIDISWTNGDGINRIIVMREVNAVTATPTDGSTYSAN